jgi:hypothetical protein
MAITHKFKTYDFGNNFKTENAILEVGDYEPEIMILGTFNPLTTNEANMADFFYGRNWFWPSIFNILNHQKIVHTKQRKFTLPPEYCPTLEEIKKLCEKYKLTFADMISSVLHLDNIEFHIIRNRVFVHNEEYNLIKDSDLAELHSKNQVEWNTEFFKIHLTQNKSIETVYFTRKPVEPYLSKWNSIVQHDYGRKINFKKLFTPSGQGLKGRPRGKRLIHHWLFNDSDNYDKIDNDWLLKHGIDRDLFFYP